jgi:CBS domain-containing protein
MADAAEARDETTEQDADQLRRDIADTRAQMGETVQEIEHRVDPRIAYQQRKARMRQQLDEAKRSGTDRMAGVRERISRRAKDVPVVAPVAGATTGVAAIGTLAELLRRRRARLRAEQARDAGSATGVGALVTVAVVARLVRSRRRAKPAGALTARDIMTAGAECLTETDTLVDAARRMAGLDVGALPICGANGRLRGMLTDRDIVVKAIAYRLDLGVATAGQLAEGKPVTIGADDSVAEALRTMSRHGVRRLPVIDGRTLVGVVSQADIAIHVQDEQVGALIESISAAP